MCGRRHPPAIESGPAPWIFSPLGRGAFGNLMRVFDDRDFVFYSEFLPLQRDHDVEVREGTVGFLIEGFFQAAMFGPKRFNTILL